MKVDFSLLRLFFLSLVFFSFHLKSEDLIKQLEDKFFEEGVLLKEENRSILGLDQEVFSEEENLSDENLVEDLEERFYREEMLLEEERLSNWEHYRDSLQKDKINAQTSDSSALHEDYRLQVGDKLFVSIYGESNTGRPLVVDSTGSINYLLAGRVFVLGKTIIEVREALTEEINQFFKHAMVAVTPVEFGSQHYTVLGEVNNPGKKILQGKTSLLTAISLSGGLTEGSFRSQTVDLADLSQAFLARKGEYIPVDFNRLIIEGDLSQDVDLISGDYIYIPNALQKEIHILGEVNQPTTIGFINTVSLVEALAQARGFTDRASSRVAVIRGSLSCPQKFLIDINLILRGCEPDFLLVPGDIVYAPPRRFNTLREIARLGIRSFVAGMALEAGEAAVRAINPDYVGSGGAVISTDN